MASEARTLRCGHVRRADPDASGRGLETIEAALRRGAGKEVVDEASGIFDASFEMTLYRLQGLGFIPSDVRQGALAFGE